MRAIHGWVLALSLAGCAMSHQLGDDAALPEDASALDAALTTDAAADAGLTDGARDADSSRDEDGGEIVRCGPNVCRSGEICCNAACGVCAFEGECVDHGCL